MKGTRPARERAFTLIELLVVIAIILILAGILLPTISAIMTKGLCANTLGTIKSIDLAIHEYKNTVGDWPVSSDLYDDLSGEYTIPGVPGTCGPYSDFKAEQLNASNEVIDAFDNPLVYIPRTEYSGALGATRDAPATTDFYNAGSFQIYSCGPDGETAATACWRGVSKQNNSGTDAKSRDDINNWTR